MPIQPRFYDTLKDLNFTTINKTANYYGLSLILGGAESSLWEVTNAYVGIASTLNFFNASSREYSAAEYSTPTFIKETLVNFGSKPYSPPIFNAGAIYHTFNSLQKVNRPKSEENLTTIQRPVCISSEFTIIKQHSKRNRRLKTGQNIGLMRNYLKIQINKLFIEFVS